MPHHTLGLAGHFAIPETLQDSMARRGIFIKKISSDYMLEYQNSDIAENALPDFINKKNPVTREELQRLAAFLHQPIRASTQSHEDRVFVQNLVHFLATGEAELPRQGSAAAAHEFLEGDEHVEVENEMREQGFWESQPELLNNYDPKSGEFVLTIRPPDTRIPEQAMLHGQILNIMGSPVQKDGSVRLSATRLQQFCSEIPCHSQTLKPLQEAVSYHNNLEQALTRIEAVDLDKLRMAASCLRTIISDPAVAKIHARHHRASMDPDLVSKILKKIDTYEGVLNSYLARGERTMPAAVVREQFAGLLSFGREVMNVIARAQNDKSISRNKSQKTKVHHLFDDLGLDDVAPDYEAIIDSLKIYFHQAGPPLHRAGRAAWHTTKDFIGDMVNFVRESPHVALPAIAGLGGVLYYFGSGNTAQAAQAANDTIMVFGPNGLESVPVDLASLPQEALTKQNWHYDMGPFGLYKHYMYNNAVTGPVEKILDGLRIGTHWVYEKLGLERNFNNSFSRAADQVVRPYADLLFKANVFQNFTHAFFWAYTLKHGFKHGLGAFPKVAKLFAPLADIGWEAGTKAAEKLHLKKRQPHAIAEHTLQKLKMDAAITVELLKEKKSLAREFAKVAGIGTAAALASSVALDMAGAGNTISDALSQAAGYGTAGTLTTGTFLVYNFVEDILGVHMAGGAMLMGAGAATNYAYQRGLKPAWRAAREGLGNIRKPRATSNDAAVPVIEA